MITEDDLPNERIQLVFESLTKAITESGEEDAQVILAAFVHKVASIFAYFCDTDDEAGEVTVAYANDILCHVPIYRDRMKQQDKIGDTVGEA